MLIMTFVAAGLAQPGGYVPPPPGKPDAITVCKSVIDWKTLESSSIEARLSEFVPRMEAEFAKQSLTEAEKVRFRAICGAYYFGVKDMMNHALELLETTKK